MPVERVIGPYEYRPAVCRDHDPRAAEAARRVAALIEPHLPVRVEHVGSTSVPGCAGKGVVDLLLIYPDGHLAAARGLLDALGFQRQTGRDPFPEARPMRVGSCRHDGATFLLHVHVVAVSSPEVSQMRSFRDRLRADPALVAGYVAAKRAILADGVTDAIDYCIRKGEFVTREVAMPSEKEKMLAGQLYDPLDAELVRARDRARNLCQDLNATREADQEARRRILTELFGSGGDSVWMQPPFFCDYGSNILLGKKCFFNFNCVVLDVCRVTIGDFTLFGPAVQVYTATHPLNAELRRKQEFGKPIEIGSDVWVGGGAIICPGVKVGSRSVIGAGSVITRDIPEGVFAAGNPCRVVREITE